MIFLSHSWNEKPIARRIVEALARCGLPAWLDEQQLPAGALLRPGLFKAIAESDVYLDLVSAGANDSNWVQDDLSQAIARENSGLQIFAVRLGGDTTPLPDLLNGRVYHELSTGGGGVARLANNKTERTAWPPKKPKHASRSTSCSKRPTGDFGTRPRARPTSFSNPMSS
ncbi:MAG: toll/interleukin-1 receptor domain-containing protein [Myxococcales bacterium]|nr:toll/interleukin-1 receptor domain-containing protein [Myxococcales bacterium]